VSSESSLEATALALAALALGLAAPAPAAAQAPAEGAIRLEVMVSQISDEPGPVDARASRLDAQLRQQFRYQSLRVVDTHTLDLALDQVGNVALPGGSTLRLKPILRDARGALVAVDLPGVIQMDMRVRNGQLVVLGAQRYGDGKLVISLEPRF
jgi:hypothetical protein